jgi:hypothetical protein
LGIHYITVVEGSKDYFNWEWVASLPAVHETKFLKHVRVDSPFVLKIDGRKTQCVIFQ